MPLWRDNRTLPPVDIWPGLGEWLLSMLGLLSSSSLSLLSPEDSIRSWSTYHFPGGSMWHVLSQLTVILTELSHDLSAAGQVTCEDIQLCLVTVISIMISHVNFSINCQAGDHHNILLSLLHSNLFSRESELFVLGSGITSLTLLNRTCDRTNTEAGKKGPQEYQFSGRDIWRRPKILTNVIVYKGLEILIIVESPVHSVLPCKCSRE